jgi:hypothetical protein
VPTKYTRDSGDNFFLLVDAAASMGTNIKKRAAGGVRRVGGLGLNCGDNASMGFSHLAAQHEFEWFRAV